MAESEQRLPKIRQDSMQTHVVAFLRDAILDGVFAPGEHLAEAELAEQLGVSRGPVRAALQELASKGMIEISSYRGASVARLSPSDILEILDLRIMLEGYAARKVAELASDEQVAHLRAIHDEMQQLAAQGRLSALVKKDMEFHEEICRLSRNSRLLQVWHLFAGQIEMFLNLSDKVYIEADVIARLHTAEVEAILARDADAAAEAAAAALRDTVQIILAKMDQE